MLIEEINKSEMGTYDAKNRQGAWNRFGTIKKKIDFVNHFSLSS